MPIQRITSFKFNNEADIPGFLEQYKILSQTNQKVPLLTSPHLREARLKPLRTANPISSP